MRANKHIFIPTFISITLVVLVVYSCRKPVIVNEDPSLKLEFSNDSIIFDTVFTSLGSTTHRLMVYNPSKNRVNISNIRMASGDQSAFRLNIDGESGSDFSDIEINGNDSIYIFARVTIDPTNANNPYVVEDSIMFLTNGNEQKVKLVAWGQNAVYILADTYVSGFPPFKVVADSLETTTWTNEKPYVIYGYAVIDSYGKLEIQAGTQIHFHENSGLWAYVDGVLKVYGTRDNPVWFGGDRLEQDYADLPGQWDRIWLMEGRQGEDHEIHNAVIENGFIGIQAESFLRPTENSLILDNVVVQNMTGIGIFSRVFNISGANVVSANCGGYCMAFTGGGNYSFVHATVADYWPYGVRNTPSVFLSNYLLDTTETPIPVNMNFQLKNSLVYGSNFNEFETDMIGDADSIYFFDHCLLKTELDINNSAIFKQVIKNEDPLFVDYEVNDYRIDTLSPAIDKGDPAIAATVPFDLLGTQRTQSPDLGAYEFVPGQGDGRFFWK
jgi:hypothetical protein